MNIRVSFFLAIFFIVLLTNLRTQNLYVGSNTSGNTTNLTSGTYNYDYTYIGYNNGVSNNSLGIANLGTMFYNSQDINVGYAGSENSLIVSNAGSCISFGGGINIGYLNTSLNNSMVIISSSNGPSYCIFNNDLNVGYSGSGNRITIADGAELEAMNGYIGNQNSASNNYIVITGVNSNSIASSYLGLNGDLNVGYNGSGNYLNVSDGAYLNATNVYIGNQNTASNNYVVVTGVDSNRLYYSSLGLYGDLNVGYSGSDNSLNIADGAGLNAMNSYIGYQNNSSNNYIIVTGVDSNSAYPSDLMLSGDLNVGYSGSGNSIIITNGSYLIAINEYIGNQSSASNNYMVVAGVDYNIYYASHIYLSGDLNVGYSGSDNNLTIADGGYFGANNGYIGNQSTVSNNYIVVTGVDSNTGYYSSLNLSGDLNVGYSGSDNTLIISNGGQCSDVNGWISYTNGTSNNNVLVAGSNSLWANTEAITIGNSSGTGTLTISDNAQVAATNIFVQNGLLIFNTGSPVGSSTVTLGASSSTNTPLLLITTNATIDALTWYTNGQLVISPATQQILTINGPLTLGDGSNAQVSIQLLNQMLTNNQTINLLSYNASYNSSLTTNNFTIANLEGANIQLIENIGFITVQATTKSCSEITITNSLTVSNYTISCGYLNVASNGILTTSNITIESPAILEGSGVINLQGGNINIYGTFAPDVGN